MSFVQQVSSTKVEILFPGNLQKSHITKPVEKIVWRLLNKIFEIPRLARTIIKGKDRNGECNCF